MITLNPRIKPEDALSILNALPGSHLILAPDVPHFTIAGVTDSYLIDTYLMREEVLGKGLFETLTDNPNSPNATGVKNLSASLQYVLEYKKEHHMADQRYDIKNPYTGAWEYRTWRPLNKPVLDSDGNVQYIIHWVEDVTEKLRLQEEARKTHQRLEESESRFRNMVDQAPVGILFTRGEDVVSESVNAPMLRFMNKISEEEVLGKKMLDVLPELKNQPALQTVINVQKTGTPWVGTEVPVALITEGSMEPHYFNFSYTPVREEGNVTGVLHVAIDVTGQVRARQNLEAAQRTTEKQKRQYEAITNNTPDLLYIFDLNYRFIYANEALLTMWGKTKEAAFGKGLRDLGYEEWHAEMHEREIDQIRTTRKPVRGIVSFPHAELGKRIYDYLLVPVLNQDGEVEAVAGTTRDITEIKQAEIILEQKVKERTQELAQANEALQESNRELNRSNHQLEEFAHAASHDLKEPIRKINVFTSQLKIKLGDRLNKEEQRMLDRVEDSAERMNTLVEDLLIYSEVSLRPYEKQSVDLNKKIARVLEDLELDITDKAAIIRVSNLPVIQGHQRQLQQLFQNLISNALKYSKSGVLPQINITASIVKEGETLYHVINVTDNGIGFKQEYAEKIFRMFTRLHGRNEYSGTGIGLSIVKKVVENHNGFIQVESTLGKGSIFRVYLPTQ